jgi:hypothetical protein
MDVQDCTAQGAENASMNHQNVNQNLRAMTIHRVDQEAVQEAEVILHLISVIDLAIAVKYLLLRLILCGT